MKILSRLYGFKPIAAVIQNTFARKDKNTVQGVDPADIKEVAHQLEAALIMAEDTPWDSVMTLSFSRRELSAFVCYMRELDTEYRRLLPKRPPPTSLITDEVTDR